MNKVECEKQKVHTIAVNLRVDAYDIYVGRGSIWGNPFSHKNNTKAKHVVATREESIELHRRWLLAQPHLIAQLGDLYGKKLGCFCSPKTCHAETLAELAENFHNSEDFSDYSAFW